MACWRRLRRWRRHFTPVLIITLIVVATCLFAFIGLHQQRAKPVATKQDKILCWAPVRLRNLPIKGKAIMETWVRRCDKGLFFSSRPKPKTVNSRKDALLHTSDKGGNQSKVTSTEGGRDNNSYNEHSFANRSHSNYTVSDIKGMPVVFLEVEEGRRHLTAKVVLALVYCYQLHGNDFDWFLKADDDTYIVMENLRLLLTSYDPRDPIILGYRFKPFTPQGYMSGGAGYVLSREALRRLVEDGILAKKCGPFSGVEDLDMGRCLYQVGVKAEESIDQEGRERFHHLSFTTYFGHPFSILPKWITSYAYHPFRRGMECCSNTTISFHYLKPHEMYMIEFLLYHLTH